MKARLFSHTTPLALALQGGGAHGAYTWGILDRLLEDDRLEIAAISGTSAGAMNAVALAYGLAAGGRDGARAALQQFWRAVGSKVPFEPFTIGHADTLGFGLAARAWRHWLRLLSPLQLNPLGIDPLREILAEQIDFERLRASNLVRLFIAATHANSGRLRPFENAELDIDAVLASACLPTLQPAVMIDGEPYWDGGYSANPALFPLVRTGIRDLLVVWLSPLVHDQSPVNAEAIRERALDFAFTATALREACLLGELCASARQAFWLFSGLERRLARLRTHLIDAHDDLAGLPAGTRLNAHGPFLERLRDCGRDRASRWLAGPGRQVGRASSVDLQQLFALPIPPTITPGAAT